MNRDLIFLEIAKNSEAMSALPQTVQEQILDFKKKNEEEVLRKEAERKRLEEEAAKERERRSEAQRKESDKLLCKGKWGEKVPLERRFVLCEKDGKRYVAGYHSWDDKDPENWVPEKQYCAIDLVRGYKSPYWNYFGCGLPGEEFVKRRIKPVLEAKTESDLVRFLRSEYDFFNVEDREKDEKFCVCTYSFSPYFTITGRGEYKTLAEHQADLKREFGKSSVARRANG